MKPQPTAYLDDLTAADRTRIQVLKNQILRRMAVFYLPPALLSIAALVYVNANSIRLGLGNSENLLGFINVVLVVVAALTLRLFVNHIISSTKESKNWQKKVIQGKINGKKGNIVFIGNQQVKLDAAHAEQVKEGDDVIIGQAITTGWILSLQKREPAA